MNFKPQFTKVKKEGEEALRYEPITKYMATDVVTFHPDQFIYEVIDVLLERNISGAPVLNDNKELIGILSEKDCLRVIIDKAYNNHPINKVRVKDLMSTQVITVTLDKDVVDLANEFLRSNFKRFPVVDDNGKLVGQISRRDILRAAKNIESTTWQYHTD